jgi:hypothetical protein
MLFNNLPQAGVIRTLQMDRVFGQIAMGVSTHMGRYANNGRILLVNPQVPKFGCPRCRL